MPERSSSSTPAPPDRASGPGRRPGDARPYVGSLYDFATGEPEDGRDAVHLDPGPAEPMREHDWTAADDWATASPAEPARPSAEPAGAGGAPPPAAAGDGAYGVPPPDEQMAFRIVPDDEGDAPATAAVARAARPPAPVPAPPVLPLEGLHPAALTRVEARRALREKAELLRRHARLIAAVAAVVLTAFALYAALAPRRYTAYSVLLIQTNRPAGEQGDFAGAFVDAPGLEGRKTLNQALILQQAPAIAERTARRLLARPDAAGLPLVRALGPAPTPQVLAAHIQEEVVEVKPAAEETDALRVEATSADAREAALVAALYTEEYVALTRETSRADVSAMRRFLEDQVGRRQGQLDELEHQLADYRAGANAIALDAQTSGAIEQVAALQAGLDEARVEAQMRAATVRTLDRELAGVGARISTSAASTARPELEGLDQQIAELDRVVERIYLRNPELRGRPDAHPDLAALEGRLRRLRAEKQRLAGERARSVVAAGGLDPASEGANGQGYVAELGRQIAQERALLEGAHASAGAYAARLGQASGQLQGVPERARRLAGLERGRASTETLLLALTTKLQEARVAEESELGLAQVVRRAQVPPRPTSPNVPLLLGVGGVLGLLLGLGAALVRYRTDARVYTPADLAELGFVVAGTVPDLGARAKAAPVPVEGAQVPPSLVALVEPFAPEAEAFRHLHAALAGGTMEAGAGIPQVVLIAGPEVGTGKSLVAANLAVVAAQAGRRTLLLDADLRRPAARRYLGLGDRPALGEGPEGANVVYWNTVVPGLFALTAREAAERPDELWSPEQAARLLAHLRTAFDLIVVDAPAALVAADAALLAPHADAALLVVQAGRTDADALTQVAAELSRAGLGPIGAVLNRFDAAHAVGYRRTLGVRHAERYVPRP